MCKADYLNCNKTESMSQIAALYILLVNIRAKTVSVVIVNPTVTEAKQISPVVILIWQLSNKPTQGYQEILINERKWINEIYLNDSDTNWPKESHSSSHHSSHFFYGTS